MRKVLLTLFAVTLVFGLVLALDASDATAMSSFKSLPSGMDNCATCHTGAVLRKMPDHTGKTGTCESCHSKPAPAPAPAPAPKPTAPAPSTTAPAVSAPKPAAAPAPVVPKVVKKNMDFTVVGVVGGTKYTAKNTYEVVIDNGHAYIKVREFIGLAGGYLNITNFSWDNNAKAVHLATSVNHGVLHTKKKAFEINGVEIVPAQGAKIINNHAYIPVRAFVEALGGTVQFDAKTGITIFVPKF
ncbi:MAG: hypothetical protein KGZ96_05575 [Clostridia bacterium]|jgi:hypothetical protein|nr:hypothetical protein [Clostridia bacterium]